MTRAEIRRFVAALLPRPAATGDARLKLRQAHADIDYWKARFHRRDAAIHRLKESCVRFKQLVTQAQRHADASKSQTLSPAVLRQLLPMRATERPVLCGDASLARERDGALSRASAEYAALVDDASRRTSCLEKVEIEGMPWWLPRDTGADAAGRSKKLQGQGFPLRVILQTREVSLGGVMVDVGANVGRTSIPRVLLGDIRASYAAEPDPVNYACLLQNLLEHDLRGFVLPDRVAIGHARGEVRLRTSKYIGGHRVLTRDAGDVESVAVQLWPLDEWLPHVGADPRSVSFVKVDTQGFELSVLRGAASLVARSHVAWQIEVDPGLLGRAGASMSDLLAHLGAHFTAFVDIGRAGAGGRWRPTSQIAEALDYVGRDQSKTDVIVYRGVPVTRPAVLP
jgi:FkbM family methyltransferase